RLIGKHDRIRTAPVHGNGDSAALWLTTIWRFESNGWPRERLFAFDQPMPLARDDDAVPQPGRSSTAESMVFLKAKVRRVLDVTGASRLILVGNSRGGNAIRNYLRERRWSGEREPAWCWAATRRTASGRCRGCARSAVPRVCRPS
ncbi:MAG: hypothetical protein QM805_05565, partial [Pseudomonas sp.]